MYDGDHWMRGHGWGGGCLGPHQRGDGADSGGNGHGDRFGIRYLMVLQQVSPQPAANIADNCESLLTSGRPRWDRRNEYRSRMAVLSKHR